MEQVVPQFPVIFITLQNDAPAIFMVCYQLVKLDFTCRGEQWSMMTYSPGRLRGED